ncbi:hypothetical protein [Niveibacterium terrae]|uniref:hypothetical protein n=1 Tax=Niveibacterium terrae TaxID=3373598 RepID=UPI003A937016
MLAVLPISVVAVSCLLVGPWLAKERQIAALRNWFLGTLVILGVTLGFASLGVEQAKTGELVFTYAALLMAFPSSMVLPFAETLAEPLRRTGLMPGLLFAWFVCVTVGRIQWWLLVLLRDYLKQTRH